MQFPSKWVAHCHCSQCQHSHGAAFVTWVGVNDYQLSIHDAQQSLKWFPSLPEAERGFCSNCGSSLFFRSPRWPGEIHVARANFCEPVDRNPQIHAYYDTHVSWVTINDDLPKKADTDS